MPRALDPRQRFPIVLESDKGKDPAPTFYFKFLTAAEFMQVCETAAGLQTATQDTDLYGPVYSSLRIGLVGWEHLVGPLGTINYAPSALESILDFGEACELLAKMRSAVTFGTEDAKKSESPQASGSASSVAPVAADASTSPTKVPRSKSSAPAARGTAAKNAEADISA